MSVSQGLLLLAGQADFKLGHFNHKELSSYLLEIPNDVHMLLSQILIGCPLLS